MPHQSSLPTLVACGALLATSAVAAEPQSTSVAAGRLVAEQHCATCHAIGDGQSPLQDAPTFSRLHLRYGAGGLGELLGRGMIKDWPTPLEEGSRQLHQRMPAFQLSLDEVAALSAYLATFEEGDRKAPSRSKSK